MFVNCPKCHELVKKGAEKCPFCGRVFNVTDFENFERREKELEDDYQNEFDEEVRFRSKTRDIFLIAAIVICGAFYVVALTTDIMPDLFVAIVSVVVVIMRIILFKSNAFRCPSCGRYITSRGGSGSYCKYCGGRIR